MPRKRSQAEAIAASRKAHGDRYDYSLVEYRNSRTKVRVICSSHGPFDVQPSHHAKGVGCRHCFFDSQRKGLAAFLTRSEAAHGSRFDYREVPDSIKRMDKVSIRCMIHDRRFDQLASAHMQGYVGCQECLSNKLSGPASLRGKFKTDQDTLAQFVARAATTHGTAYRYNHFVYKGAAKKGEIICATHGSFHQTPSNHLRGTGCPHCAREAKHQESFKAECKRNGVDYWSALKRREAGMSTERVMSAALLRSDRLVNPITVHSKTYPNMKAAIRHLRPVASGHTIARSIAAGAAPEDAFAAIPNPGYANGVIYLIEHQPTGKKYVGLTIVSEAKRWRQHVEQAQARHIKSLDSLHTAIRAYGENEFSISVIDHGTTKRDLERLERQWIKKLDTLTPSGFNISPGGGSGGAMGRPTDVDGKRFAKVLEAASHVAETRGITLEAAKGRLRSGRLDVVAPSKPGHAVCTTPAYKAWSRIVHCATNPRSKDFISGLTLHAEWGNFQAFLRDVGQPPEQGHVFARIDKDKGFSPANCAWMSKTEASRLNAAQMKAKGRLVGRRQKRP